MLPSMSSDRILAYRVFKGEIEKIEGIARSQERQLSGVELLVIDYLKNRMESMVKKGNSYDDASG